MARLLSRRTQTVLLSLLALFLLGTVIVLSAVRAYFSIDQSAYIEAEELGTWDEIRWGSATDDLPLGWAARYPWLAKMLSSPPRPSDAAFPPGAAPAGAASAGSVAGSPSLDALAKDFAGPAFDNTPKPWSPMSPKEKIPRIIHQTWKDSTLPPKWQAVREECQAMHPDYEYMLWTDADSRKFLVEHYDWFVPIFDAYPYAIQRADAIRYFVLHKYGGIYMDLDVGCLRRFDPLLRFEVILPKTIPVGVSNDIMLSAKGHPFMDQLIHNLVTFNHRYLTNYPTVMFSTGPMFVSASYRIYVDAHGPAIPSTPSKPAAGFEGVRVLPKSLYGKNAKPGDAPNAFFKHFYGSSWHANDASFLILLRDYGKGLMLIGALVVVYGAAKTMLPRVLHSLRRESARSALGRRRDQSGSAAPVSSAGRWISLPLRAADTRGSRRAHSAAYSRLSDVDSNAARPPGAASGVNNLTRVAAPRPQRYSLPMFDLADGDGEADTSEAGSGGAYADEETSSDLSVESSRHPAAQGLLSWVGSGFARPSTASSEADRSPNAGDGGGLVRSGTASKDKRTKQRKGSSNGGGTLYLPAFFVGGSSTNAAEPASSSRTSPTDTAGWATGARARMGSDESTLGHSRASSLGAWAAGLLPPNWRAASPGALATVNQWLGRTPSPALAEDVERIGSGRPGASFPMNPSPSSGSGRFASTWGEGAHSSLSGKGGKHLGRPSTSPGLPAIALDMESPPPPYIDGSGTSASRARHEQGTSVTPSLGESSASVANGDPSVLRPGLMKRPSRGSLRETSQNDAASPKGVADAAEIGARSETPPVALAPPQSDAEDVYTASDRSRSLQDSIARPAR